jgi:hypothetical protein
MSKVGYAKLFKLARDAHNWNFKSTKRQEKKGDANHLQGTMNKK